MESGEIIVNLLLSFAILVVEEAYDNTRQVIHLLRHKTYLNE